MKIDPKLVVTADDDRSLWGFVYQALRGELKFLYDDESRHEEAEKMISQEINRFANRCFQKGIEYQKQQQK